MKSALAIQRVILFLSLLCTLLTGLSAFVLGRDHKSRGYQKGLQQQQPYPVKQDHGLYGNAEPASKGHASTTVAESTTTNTSIPTSNHKNPIDVYGIDHVVLLVNDLKGMAEWYETVLGCKVAKHNEKFQMIHLDAGSALIDLVDKAGPLGNQNHEDLNDGDNDSCQQQQQQQHYQRMDHICLGLTRFDEIAIRDHLSSHGVVITTEVGVRYGKGGYGESLYFEDPEGTRIEIKKTRLLG